MQLASQAVRKFVDGRGGSEYDDLDYHEIFKDRVFGKEAFE